MRVWLLLLSVLCLARGDNIILPSPSSSGDKVGIIFMPGASCYPITYKKLLTQMQAQFGLKNMALTAAIMSFSFNQVNPIQMAGKIRDGVKILKAANVTSIYVAAHSQGGVFAQDTLSKGHDDVKGLILMSSVILRKHRSLNEQGQSEFQMKMNTTSVLGTKDGLLRITRGAEAFWHQHINEVPSNHSHTLLAVEGLSHRSFLDPDYVPSFVTDNDLDSDLTQEQGYAKVGQLVAEWVDSLLRGGDWQNRAVQMSHVLLKGMLDAMVLEGNYNLKPPCYSHELVNQPQANCTTGSPWVDLHVQSSMAGPVPPQISLSNQDNFHRTYSVNPVHNPQVNNTCDEQTDQPCTLFTVTASEAIYEKLEVIDSGKTPQAASEIKCKLSSRQMIQHSVNATDQSFHDLDEVGNRCGEINQIAIDWAMSAVTPAALNNYINYGRKLTIGHDQGPYDNGVQWIWTFMNYTDTHDGRVLVRSPYMSTHLIQPDSAAPGIHFCKVLSPFKVVEWIYIDSLRKW